MENLRSSNMRTMQTQALMGRGGDYTKDVERLNSQTYFTHENVKEKKFGVLHEKAIRALAQQLSREQRRATLSQGALKDLAYVSLCYGLFNTALEIDSGTCSADGAIKRNHYKTSKRLNRRIEKLRDRLHAVMHKYAHEAKRMRKMNEKLFGSTMVGTEPTQLDYLGVFIYLLRFYERDKPCLEDFKVISEAELYELSDLVGMTQAGGSEGRMYELACEMVKVL